MTLIAQREGMPETQRHALKRAKLLSWLTIGYLLMDTAILFLIKGNSQAMQAAWIQDLLALIPPVAFLVGIWVASLPATKHHPYGFHQAVDVAHFVAAASLLAFGGYLLVESVMTLLTAQAPAIGLMSVFGLELWQGWIMIAFMAAGVIPPLILGRLKLEPARQLHNRVLFTDSQMNKADWLSSAASIIGVTCIGFGLWWADAVAAIIISVDILVDGVRNVKSSLNSMVESNPRTMETEDPHPLPTSLNSYLMQLPWISQAGCRVREEGHVFHVEAFVVTHPGKGSLVDLIDEARDGCLALDWKIHEVVIMPVHELCSVLQTDTKAGEVSPN